MPHRRLATRRFLATVLFTDIVGSTQHAARLGDRAWRVLVERHDAVVRRELKVYGGEEMDRAGDGFFAVFEAPERAVRCAEAITTGVAPLGIQVRAGVHMGECEVIGGKVGGMAVAIGARVGGLAGPGEVLVSGSVRDLMTGSDRRFEGGEARELKGVEDPWRVYRLVPTTVNGDVVASRHPSMVPLYTRRQRRWLVVALAGVMALVLAVSGTYLLTRSEADVVVGEDAVGVIGPGDVVQVSEAVEVGARPTGVAGRGASVWVTNSTAGSVSKIDRATNVSVPIAVGASPSGVAVGAGAVWVANSGDSTVSRIDPETSQVTTIPVRPGPTGIVVAFGSVWVTNALDAAVTEIDPDTNTVAHEVSVGASPTGIAAGAGYLWVTNQGDATVTRFHPQSYVKDSPVPVGNGPVGIAVTDDAAWVANNLDGSLSRIDVEDLSVDARTLDKKGGAYGVAASGGEVWVSNEHARTLMQVTAETFRLAAKVQLAGSPLGLAFVGDDLWFTSAAGGSALHRGGVLTMVGTWGLEQADGAPDTDLTLHYSGASWQLAQLTNDGLFGFRRAGGVQGATVVPDLATSRPTPTDGGRTYTFHLRKGVRYSTGEPVLAGDIRRGIERSVLYSATPTYLRSVIVGAKACWEAAEKAVAADKPRPRCDLSSGIVADDRTGTITFHLTEPKPEFVYQLALPNASAIPQDTPDVLPKGTYLPATGPYKIRSLNPERIATGLPTLPGRLELVRNPYFREWSPAAQPAGYPDRIVLKTGYTAGQAVAQVADGRADLVFDLEPSGHVERLGTRYGSQIHATTGVYTQFLYLNPATPPFDDVDARRAVAYALDRRALTNASWGRSAPVTCQLIPPGFAAYRHYCPFTLPGGAQGQWTAPDVAKADALVRRSGTRGAEVVVLSEDFPGVRSLVKATGDVLRGLGYRVSVRRVQGSWDYAKTHRHRWDLVFAGWGADYPAASTYIAPVAACDPDVGGLNLARYCDEEIDSQINAALLQQVTDPGSANDAWSRIDREVVESAVVIPFGISLRQDFVSRRVGNIPLHPLTGPLIAQMWVQ